MASMKIGIIGLGRMGESVAHRLIKDNHEVIGYDPNIKLKNIKTVNSIKGLTKQVEIIWLMVPAGETVDKVINEIVPHIKQNSIIIDGGNSNFEDTIQRYKRLENKNINYIDCGTSGGLKGREIGFSLMIGGKKEIYEKLKPIFKSIAAPNGFEYMGLSGAGHYVKMIHNGIEYSLLQSYAEGLNLLKNNTNYKNLNLEKMTKVWSHGSIIRSFITELAHDIFKQDQNLENISGSIGENLTGKWTLEEAEKQNIPMDLLKKSLEIRKWSRESGGNYATKIVAILRNAFGGHKIKKIKRD